MWSENPIGFEPCQIYALVPVFFFFIKTLTWLRMKELSLECIPVTSRQYSLLSYKCHP